MDKIIEDLIVRSTFTSLKSQGHDNREPSHYKFLFCIRGYTTPIVIQNTTSLIIH